jgi:DedD protein
LAEAARAQALLEGKPVPAPVPRPEKADGQRFIVQVGAYSEDVRAQQVRNQLERAGLKTYTHVAETAEGRRIRVRLGPFTTRADADKAAAKAKALGVSPAILTL